MLAQLKLNVPAPGAALVLRALRETSPDILSTVVFQHHEDGEFGLLLLRRPQRRIIQIEAIEDLIVFVTRRGMRVVGEGFCVGALEKQHG